MQQLLYLLPTLMCPLGMGAMMWLMMRGKNQPQTDHNDSAAQVQELARLRSEIADLRANAQPTGTTTPGAPAVPLDKHHGAAL